jgi:hypothetical protein
MEANMASSVIDGIDFGPLAVLVGMWEGDKGMDMAPEPNGESATPYFDSLQFEIVGDVTNAEKQTLSVLRYYQVVKRKDTGDVFHNETGYWMYDPATGLVMQSLTIPRGVALLAGGNAGDFDVSGEVSIDVKATDGETEFGILQQGFMKDNARTTAFTHNITVNGDQMSYSETTSLEIYGRSYAHTDENTLSRVS